MAVRGRRGAVADMGGDLVSEETYTKADIMRALSMVEAPVTDDPREDDIDTLKFFNAGANVLASVLLDGMDAEQAKGLKARKMAETAFESIMRMAMKGIDAERKGLL